MASERFTDLSRATDSNANSLAGAQWFFFATGTTTPQSVYSNADLSVPLGTLVTADGGGKFPPIYLDATKAYRGILKTAGGSTIQDIDPLNSIVEQAIDQPAAAAAIAADWASFPALQRAIAAARVSPGTVTIKFVGVGDSNGVGAGVSVANTPVRVAARTAQEALDPQGDAIWETENYSVNGSIVSGYFQATSVDDPTTPAEYVEASEATVVIVAYSANDPAPESYNAAQGLDGVYNANVAMLNHINAQDADVVVMTSPHAHVGKIKAETDGRSGLMLNATIPMVYPRGGTWRLGRTDMPILEVSYTFTAATKRVTVNGVAGAFNSTGPGFGLAVGKKIEIRLPTGAVDPTNGGVYSIASIDPSGNWIELDREWLFDGSLPRASQWVDQGAAALTDGTYNAMVQRIDIDPYTELFPNVDNGWANYDYAGTGYTIPILTRYLQVNDARRRAVRNLTGRASVLDLEANYFALIALNGEDRYYAPPRSSTGTTMS